MKKLSILSFILVLLTMKYSFACGGLFCDNIQPVNQVAERIVFAQDGDNRYQMHVQIQYQGPPQQFSWMLPVPKDTEFSLSLPKLFSTLDTQFAPVFTITREAANDCSSIFDIFDADKSASDFIQYAPDEEGSAEVLSRENIGPYEKVTLQADSVEILTTWLTDNGYQVPDRAQEVLSPYIENYVFIAIKLLEGKDTGDIQPVSLHFSSPKPSIPIIPTSVAANPDMGMIVNILGSQKAIPSNYALVEINEALIDWFSQGSNYSDVVSHAIDESPNGQGFTIDYAGAHASNPFEFDPLFPESDLNVLREVSTVNDLRMDVDVLMGLLIDESDLEFIDTNSVHYLASKIFEDEYKRQIGDYDSFYSCIFQQASQGLGQESECDMIFNTAIDGAIIAERIQFEVNDVIVNLQNIFNNNPYLTRLYTTLSANEMTLDPEFSFNPDITSDVSNRRNATVYFDCESGEDLYIRLSNGNEVDLNDGVNTNLVQRENGETVRGEDQIGASLISRPLESGQAEIITDNRTTLKKRYQVSSDGCQQSPNLGLLFFAVFVMIFGLKRRSA
jgi:hypothetical protein